jgi:hypothetical protein
LLLDEPDPAFSQFVGEGVVVDFFTEPMTERIGNAENSPNDPFGHRLQQPGIPFHPSTSRSSALKTCLGNRTDA